VAQDLLDRILEEIRDRKERSREAYEESQRLRAALAALEVGHAEPAPPSSSQSRGGRRRSASRRAQPGENLAKIREAVAERPGATAGEVAAATGVARATVTSTLGKLARDGEFERTSLPGGGVGYRERRQGRSDGGDTPEGSSGTEHSALAT
jgi:Fic family protein